MESYKPDIKQPWLHPMMPGDLTHDQVKGELMCYATKHDGDWSGVPKEVWHVISSYYPKWHIMKSYKLQFEGMWT